MKLDKYDWAYIIRSVEESSTMIPVIKDGLLAKIKDYANFNENVKNGLILLEKRK